MVDTVVAVLGKFNRQCEGQRDGSDGMVAEVVGVFLKILLLVSGIPASSQDQQHRIEIPCQYRV